MKSTRTQIVVTLGALFVACVAADGQTMLQAPAGAGNSPAAVLVELFTSEGCSSCPPADALLRQLDGRYTSSGTLIVGISEHVTYWDHLGWKDPFSANEYTQRQQAYARRFHLDSVYTPQVVINGHEQVLGSDRTAILQALAKEPRSMPLSLRIEGATVHGSRLAITFSVDGSLPGKEVQIFAIVADDVDHSNVGSGENAGRALAHTSVARSVTRIATGGSFTRSTVEVALPPPAQGERSPKRHLVLFAQPDEAGHVAAVALRPIDDSARTEPAARPISPQ